MLNRKKRLCPNEFRKRIPGKWCVYCGEPASQEDHFPPYSVTLRGLLLPVCSECNVIAGTAHPYNFELRAEFVKDKLRKKYNKLLESLDWENSEIKELGRNLKGKISSWEKRKKIERGRIAWNAVFYLASIDHGNDFAAFLARANGSQESDSD
jgi:hypothetical protein